MSSSWDAPWDGLNRWRVLSDQCGGICEIDEGSMKLRLLFAATIACSMLAGTTPAPAGYWNYGCKGSVGDSAVTFDRNTFLIMPKALAKGDIGGLVRAKSSPSTPTTTIPVS